MVHGKYPFLLCLLPSQARNVVEDEDEGEDEDEDDKQSNKHHRAI